MASCSARRPRARCRLPPRAYSDPFSLFGAPAAPQPIETPASGGSVAYCVRLCDGRFFPIQRSSGADPAQICSGFCPAAQTKIFSGSGIDHASARDGARYADLKNAFAYREKTIPGCTCNGKDAFGLVNTPAAADPTLRAGDIVATNTGFVTYTGGRRNAEFTPVTGRDALPAGAVPDRAVQRLTRRARAPDCRGR